MRRGDLVTVAMHGNFGKPRPALVVQSELFLNTHASVTVLLLSSSTVGAPIFRIPLEPTEENGLGLPSEIQVDQPMTVGRERLGEVIGSVTRDTMLQVDRALTVWLGIG